MVDQESYWRAAIHRIMPDLDIQSMVINHEGLVYDILINQEWVFRFAKGNMDRSCWI